MRIVRAGSAISAGTIRRSWMWGSGNNAVHLAVMVYAERDLDQWQRTIQTAPWDEAFEIASTLRTSNMGGHEPFGFKDGISEPEFDWKREHAAASDTITYTNEVALGELLLGYPNEYGKYTDRPVLETADDPTDQLLPAEDHTAKKDFGLNGSYFVLRQLEQDVRGFWQYIARNAGANPEDRYRLGALMVGRDIDGNPLIPDTGQKIAGVEEKPGTPRNAFTYDNDVSGTDCPFGAHIRRANPRKLRICSDAQAIRSRGWDPYLVSLGRNCATIFSPPLGSIVSCGGGANMGRSCPQSVRFNQRLPAKLRAGCISHALAPALPASSSLCKTRG